MQVFLPLYKLNGTRTCYWWKSCDGFCHLQDYNDGMFVNFWNISYIQGLAWYAKCLRVDEDGDVAEEFLEEVIPEVQTSTTDHSKPFPRFQINNRNRPAKVENQVILQEGKLQQCIKHQGRLLLVWRRQKTLRNDPFSQWCSGSIFLVYLHMVVDLWGWSVSFWWQRKGKTWL